MVMKTFSLQGVFKDYSYWLKKNWYYHSYCAALYKFIIPPHRRVLQIQCKSGYLLNAVQPSYGVGIDIDSEAISHAQQHYPLHRFLNQSLSDLASDKPFDYIIISGALMETDDIQNFLRLLKNHTHARSRIVVDFYSTLWEPLLTVATWLKFRQPTLLKNWVSVYDMKNFFYLAGFETITTGKQFLFPYAIPLLSWFLNTLVATIPFLNNLCLMQWLVARPAGVDQDPLSLSVSVIITCKNERGNIRAAVQRCPLMGKSTELIFVEGGSSDGTLEEIKNVIATHSRSDIQIRHFVQSGKGKGDAVRIGFAAAQGDILMILDGDLTTPPEELPKFFDALVQGKGDFINGSRLVYGMESEAMRFLNLIANYLFGIGFTWLLGQRIKDTLCGTKVLFKHDYEKIAEQRAFFGNFDPFGDFDLIFGAAKQQLKIVEMPVHYKNRTYGTTQISRFTHGMLLLRMSFFAFRRFKCRSLPGKEK